MSEKNYGDITSTRPYQCFMGRWEGLCKTFTPKGEFQAGTAVHMDVYWTGDSIWHLHEHFDDLYEVGEVVFDTDISVEGNYCHAESDQLNIWGTRLTPFNYVFTIDSGVSNTRVFNNHYFIDDNTRRIITHKVRGGKTHLFQIQDFVRIVRP